MFKAIGLTFDYVHNTVHAGLDLPGDYKLYKKCVYYPGFYAERKHRTVA